MSARNVARVGKRGNICVDNNVSATMCPRLPGPLYSKLKFKKLKKIKNGSQSRVYVRYLKSMVYCGDSYTMIAKPMKTLNCVIQ